jgi:hypothetical protein
MNNFHNVYICLFVPYSEGATGMANCGRRHTSDRRKTHTLGTVAHCSDTVYNCFTTVGHDSVLSRPPLLVPYIVE